MIVVVGAHSRKVGKTSIVCSLLQGIPELEWSAVKISSNRRGTAGVAAIEEGGGARPDCDTSRFLAAGASRAVWIRAQDAEMAGAAAVVREIAAGGRHLIVESNRIVEHLDPDVYVLALDFHIDDFKASARRLFRRADDYVLSRSTCEMPNWPDIPLDELLRKPAHRIEPPDFAPVKLIEELRRRLGLAGQEAAA
jgi:hypothetical protein